MKRYLLLISLLFTNCYTPTCFENNEKLIQLVKESQQQTDRAIAIAISWQEVNRKNEEIINQLLEELQNCKTRL